MKSANIEYLDQAKKDLIEGYWFYESQQQGLGDYFLKDVYSEIESLNSFAGIHRKVYGNYHRLLTRRFPFAVFYRLSGDAAYIYAVVDCRRDPASIQFKLKR